jgi:hypothetical protein
MEEGTSAIGRNKGEGMASVAKHVGERRKQTLEDKVRESADPTRRRKDEHNCFLHSYPKSMK